MSKLDLGQSRLMGLGHAANAAPVSCDDTGGVMLYWWIAGMRLAEARRGDAMRTASQGGRLRGGRWVRVTALLVWLAVELGVQLASQYGSLLSHILSSVCLFGSVVFVWRSFYAMRIGPAAPRRPSR